MAFDRAEVEGVHRIKKSGAVVGMSGMATIYDTNGEYRRVRFTFRDAAWDEIKAIGGNGAGIRAEVRGRVRAMCKKKWLAWKAEEPPETHVADTMDPLGDITT